MCDRCYGGERLFSHRVFRCRHVTVSDALRLVLWRRSVSQLTSKVLSFNQDPRPLSCTIDRKPTDGVSLSVSVICQSFVSSTGRRTAGDDSSGGRGRGCLLSRGDNGITPERRPSTPEGAEESAAHESCCHLL